jgi:hypothetical protein
VWRRILVFLLAQAVLLGLAITTVRAWHAAVLPAAWLGPRSGAVAGGVIGIVLGARRSSR